MKEPKPLLREGASDFERQLLSAVMRERPSPQLRSRMRYALGLTGPIAWAGSVKAMVSALASKSVVAVAVVGLVAAGVVGGRALQSEHDTAVAPEATAPAVSTVSPVASPPSAPATEQAEPVPEQTGGGELREEILVLDQVRAALQSGSGAAALEQLDAYRQRFPSGILSREAAQLRQQAGAVARVKGRGARARAPRVNSSQH
jgi:hypothetical protein